MLGKGGRNPYHRNQNLNSNSTYKTKFKGKTAALEGFIYDIGVGNQAYLLIKTTKEIAEYTERIYKESLQIRKAIEMLT